MLIIEPEDITKPFAEFIDSINNQEKLYLRSLSAHSPAESPSDISKDYPGLASDFHLPKELDYVLSHIHSSPLRLSGPGTLEFALNIIITQGPNSSGHDLEARLFG